MNFYYFVKIILFIMHFNKNRCIFIDLTVTRWYYFIYFLYKIYISKHTNLKTGHTNFFVLGKDYFMQILCLGDSITDCNHLFEDFPLGNGYVQLLAEKLPCNVQIKNHGIDGFTVSRILENIQTHRISLHRNPIITLLVGINDIGLIMNTHRT